MNLKAIKFFHPQMQLVDYGFAYPCDFDFTKYEITLFFYGKAELLC